MSIHMDGEGLIPKTIHSLGDTLAEKLQSLAQYVLVVVLGILPLFFVSSFAAPQTYVKDMLVIVGLILALIFYSLTILRSGKIKFTLPFPILAMWLIVITALTSGLLSGDFADTLLGDAFDQQTIGFLLLITMVATITAQIFTDKRSIMRLYALLTGSAVVLAVYHIFRLFFGPQFLSFGLFNGNVLSPLGTWNDLAIFFGLVILLSLVALEQLTLSEVGRWVIGGVVGVSVIMLSVINFSAIWFVLGMVSLVVLVYALAKDKFGGTAVTTRHVSTASILVATLVFLVSIVFVIGGSVIGGVITQKTGISYLEVRPSFQATTDLTRAAYHDHALFGVGPNRFADIWRTAKDPSLNGTIFWNSDFFAGIGYIPTFFITIGAIGGLLWLAMLGLFLLTGIRLLVRTAHADRGWYFIATSAFVAGAYLWGMALIYVPGPVLIIFAALATGLVASAGAALEPMRVRTLSLSGSKSSGFVLVTLVMLVVVGSVSTLYSMSQHFLAANAYADGVNLLSVNKLDAAESQTANAYKMFKSDQYARRLAEIKLVTIVNILQSNAQPTQDLQKRFQDTLVAAVQAGRAAVSLDSTDPNNWAVLGNIYSTVVPLKIDGAYDQAKSALEKARSLDPVNPSRTLALARLEQAHGDATAARNLAVDAVKQKNDYLDAIYFISQLDIAAGNIDSAISATGATIILDPQNPVRRFQLGVLFMAQNKAAEAAQALESAIALNQDYANARYYLAFAYDRLGRTVDADTQLKEILKTNPDNQLVIGLIAQLESGKKISEPAQNTTPPVPEKQGSKATVETGTLKAPDSPLLTPVNTVPDAPKKSKATE